MTACRYCWPVFKKCDIGPVSVLKARDLSTQISNYWVIGTNLQSQMWFCYFTIKIKTGCKGHIVVLDSSEISLYRLSVPILLHLLVWNMNALRELDMVHWASLAASLSQSLTVILKQKKSPESIFNPWKFHFCKTFEEPGKLFIGVWCHSAGGREKHKMFS